MRRRRLLMRMRIFSDAEKENSDAEEENSELSSEVSSSAWMRRRRLLRTVHRRK
jgi:hypothetical protein